MTDRIIDIASILAAVEKELTRLAKKQIRAEAERIRAEHRDRQRKALHLVILGGTLERIRQAPPAQPLTLSMGERGIMIDFFHHSDCPKPLSDEIWAVIYRLETQGFTLTNDGASKWVPPVEGV